METLEEAFARQAAEKQAAKAAKWQDIQERAPELAVFLMQMGKEFGKMKLIEVKFNQEEKREFQSNKIGTGALGMDKVFTLRSLWRSW